MGPKRQPWGSAASLVLASTLASTLARSHARTLARSHARTLASTPMVCGSRGNEGRGRTAQRMLLREGGRERSQSRAGEGQHKACLLSSTHRVVHTPTRRCAEPRAELVTESGARTYF